ARLCRRKRIWRGGIAGWRERRGARPGGGVLRRYACTRRRLDRKSRTRRPRGLMSANSSSHDWAFLKGFLARPWRVASPIPSGRRLARKIAEQIDPQPGGSVLELGPGTGAVTRAIRAHGVAEADLVLIESDPQFVAVLKRAFPLAHVVEGDAFAFARLLGSDARGVRTI